MTSGTGAEQAIAGAGRRFAGGVILSLCLAAWPAQAQQARTADPYLLAQSGWASLGAQRFDAALDYFDEALRNDPGYLPAEAGRARALAGLGQHDAALAITGRLSRLDPRFKLDDAAILLLVKQPERALQRIDTAADEIVAGGDRAVAMAENRDFFRRALYLRGEAYYMMKGFERAGADFERAHGLGVGSPAIRGIGDTYFAMGELTRAEKAYSRALQHRKHDGLAWHRRARVRYLQGDVEGALSDFKEAEVYLENSRDFLAQYAEALLAAENHSEAVNILNRLLRVTREDPEYQRVVRYHLAAALIDAGRPRDAEIELSTIENWQDIALERHFQRGRARFAMRDFAGAIRFFDRALALKRSDPDILYNRGIAWLRLNEVEKALDDLSEAAVRAPDDARIRDAIGRIRLSRREYDEALAFYDAAVKAHPEQVEPLIQRANAYLSTSNAGGALEDAEKALAIEPGNMDATAAASRALLALGRADEAFDYAQRLVRSVSKKKEGYLLSARASIALGRTEQAFANIEQAQNHGADPARLAMLMGDAHALDNDYNEALAYYERGVRLTGNAPHALVRRGDAHMALGQDRQAVADFTAALETYPNSYDLYLKRGRLYKRLDACASATDDFDRALQLVPGDNTAMRERGKCRISSGRLVAGFRDLFRSLI